MFTKSLLATALVLGGFALAAVPAAAEETETNERLMIVNGNSGRVIYDDGRNDLFCVTRRVIIGHDDYGRRIYRRTMRCR